jgi:hypothetical protein
MSVVFENSLFRIRRIGKPVTGNVPGAVEMTPDVVKHVENVLLGKVKADSPKRDEQRDDNMPQVTRGRLEPVH